MLISYGSKAAFVIFRGLEEAASSANRLLNLVNDTLIVCKNSTSLHILILVLFHGR